MAYKENEVVAKYTQGSMQSDCGEYNVNDLIEMFDKTEITIDEYGTTDGVTVNDCIKNDLVTKSNCKNIWRSEISFVSLYL